MSRILGDGAVNVLASCLWRSEEISLPRNVGAAWGAERIFAIMMHE